MINLSKQPPHSLLISCDSLESKFSKGYNTNIPKRDPQFEPNLSKTHKEVELETKAQNTLSLPL